MNGKNKKKPGAHRKPETVREKVQVHVEGQKFNKAQVQVQIRQALGPRRVREEALSLSYLASVLLSPLSFS